MIEFGSILFVFSLDRKMENDCTFTPFYGKFTMEIIVGYQAFDHQKFWK